MKFTKKSCQLISPIQVGEKLLTQRDWIEVKSAEMTCALAPLPGLHSETLEESYTDFISNRFSTPSALFVKEAFDQNLFSCDEVKENKLSYIDLSLSPTDFLYKYNENDVVKLKVNRGDLKLEKKWLLELFRSNKKNILFRLDANRSLTLTQLDFLVSGLDHSMIEYLEEPLKHLAEWELASQNISIPLALDENIKERESISNVSTLVVKPSFNLSISETIKEIERRKYKITISSSFDPPENMATLKYLAKMSGCYAGLDTLKYLDLATIKNSPL